MAADPADLQKVVELFEERIPFNQILGLEIESLGGLKHEVRN